MLKARTAERAVLGRQLTEGQVLAPTGGRVLRVPVTVGTVVMSGEAVATIAQQDLVLRPQVRFRPVITAATRFSRCAQLASSAPAI